MKKMSSFVYPISTLLGVLVLTFLVCIPSTAHAETRPIIFPVIGSVRYSNDFGAPRSGGRTHEGNDLLGFKGQQLISAVDGTIRYVAYPEPYWGYSITLRDTEGYTYNYYHVNDDTPGTDDGLGGGMHAYAPDADDGRPVVAGQLIGYMGDSGNAESTTPHLHFEIRRPDGTPINPYDSLNAATRFARPAIHPQASDELLPFGQFIGGASIDYGDVSPVEGIELVAGAGRGGGPHVRIFDEQGTLLGQFFAFEQGFRGGVEIATGDIDADGVDEIIVGAGPGRDPAVRMFDNVGTQLAEFIAYPLAFRGGVRVAAADLDNDGITEIITGTGPGGGPQVRVFAPDGRVITQFFAYATTFRGGVEVAATPAGPYTGSAIVTGAGRGGGPHVRIFDKYGVLTGHFFAYAEGFRGGIKVDVADVEGFDELPEVITVPASGGGAHVRLFSLQGNPVDNFTAYEEWWRGGYDIAGSENSLRIVSVGGRRTSIRTPD